MTKQREVDFKRITKHRSFIWVVAALLISIPAFLINLGMMPFTSDEPIRGIVALEMIFSDNYIVPTTKGELYYNKPPFYNWILVLVYKLFGANEITTRIPAVIFMYTFALSIVYFFKKHFNLKTAILIALMFLSCGRILFWDSMLGLIDIFYSWLCFLGFMWLIEGVLYQKWWKAFLLSYFIAALGVLMKGLPSIAFQAISILVLLIASKNIKKLFSWAHISGVIFFVAIVGAYFLVYSQHNGLDVYFQTLWVESSKRTPVDHTIWKTLVHVLKFHPDMLYHFIPWTLLSISLFHKRSLQIIKQKPVVFYIALLFLFNILIYWMSPSTIPRYLIMLIPLSYIVFYFTYTSAQKTKQWVSKCIDFLFTYITPIALSSLSFLLLYITKPEVTPLPLILLSLLSLGVFYIVFFQKKLFEGINKFLITVILLFVLRIVFNIYFLPFKTEKMWETKQKQMVKEMCEITKDKKLKILKTTNVDCTAIMYFEMCRQEILRVEHGQAIPGVYYIATSALIDAIGYTEDQYTKHYEFFMRDKWTPLYVISLNEVQ